MRTIALRLCVVSAVAAALAVLAAALLAYVTLNAYLWVATFGSLGILFGCLWAASGRIFEPGVSSLKWFASTFLIGPVCAFIVWIAAVNLGIACFVIFAAKR